MSKLNRLDIAIGILDNTEDLLEQINNQHNFEKDLSNFLNTNTYSKSKKWIFGMSNMVSDRCKNEINTLMEQQNKISDLEAKLAEVKKLLDKYCYKNINELEDVFNCNLNKVAQLSQITVDLKNDVSRRNGEILELKQQLAEKEKEIIKLKDFESDWHRWHKLAFDYNEEINKDKRIIFNLKQKIEKHNQAKTDLAIEQLEKLKELTNRSTNIDTGYLDMVCFTDIINRRIKELKEKK